MKSTKEPKLFHSPHIYEHTRGDFMWASTRALIFLFLTLIWLLPDSPLSWLLRPLAAIVLIESTLFIVVNASTVLLAMSRNMHTKLYKTWYFLQLVFVCLSIGGIVAAQNFSISPSLLNLLLDYPGLTAFLAYYLLALYLWPQLRRVRRDEQ